MCAVSKLDHVAGGGGGLQFRTLKPFRKLESPRQFIRRVAASIRAEFSTKDGQTLHDVLI
jgi:hypothetical protein